MRRRISKFAKQKPKDLRRRVGHRGPDAGEERGHVPRLDGRELLLQLLADVVAHGVAKFCAKFRSFSAVSAPIYASKYAFYSIFQNLPDYLAEIFESTSNFGKFSARFRSFSAVSAPIFAS